MTDTTQPEDAAGSEPAAPATDADPPRRWFCGLPPVVWALVVLFAFWMFFQIGVPFVTLWTTGKEAPGNLTVSLLFGTIEFEGVRAGAPIPGSLVKMYMGMVAMAILVYVSVTDAGLERFFGPVRDLLVTEATGSRLFLKCGVNGAVALLAAFLVYDANSVSLEPPAQLRTIHPTLPGRYVKLRNPLEWTDANVARGRAIYVANCSWCHGDRADGKGPFAGGFNPEPIDLSASGTIDMLKEEYLFWRIKEGGIGLPNEGWPWASAMPPWNPDRTSMGVDVPAAHRLSDEDIWLAIMGAYSVAGRKPRRTEE